MRFRIYTAATLPEAMQQVRAQLGDDAVILSTQPLEGGQGIRVTAALEDSPAETEELNGMARGLRTMDEVNDALDYHRVPAGLAERLIGMAAEVGEHDATIALAASLDTSFDFRRLAEAPGRRLMLVGPPGAGKTATAAKLCARARLQGVKAGLVTMDTVKTGGIDQATAFARALDARLAAAPDAAKLTAAVQSGGDQEFTVIDTLGVSPYDAAELGRLGRAARGAGAELLLVLPAGGDAMESAETALAFAEAGAAGLVATKLDAVRRFGGLLAAAHAAELAFVAAGIAPTIGDGLMPLNPVSLARLLLSGVATEVSQPLAAVAL